MYKTRTQKARLLVVETSVYNAYSEYQLYGAPNSDLTQLEAEDRAALAEEIDAGAKNKLQNKATSKTQNNVTFTVNSDGEVTVSTTAQGSSSNTSLDLCGSYIANTFIGNIISGVASGSTSSSYCLYVAYSNDGSSEAKAIYVNAANNPTHQILNYPYIRVFVLVYSGQIISTPVKFQPMICTKAAFGVSNKFVPYRPNYDLVVSTLEKNKVTHSKNNSSYDFHGFKITTRNRASGTAYFMGTGTTTGAGVISFSYSLSGTAILYVDKKMVIPSYVKFYYSGTNTFYIVFYTSTKWDSISILGTFTADEIEEYFSNTEVPTGATQLTETAYPT